MNADTQCYVYLIATIGKAGDCSPIKIGIAGNPESRFAAIKTSCPSPIRMQIYFGPMHRTSAKFIEQEAHKVYRRYRLHGEWFDVKPEYAMNTISDIISLVCAQNISDESSLSRFLSDMGVYAARMQNDPWRDDYR